MPPPTLCSILSDGQIQVTESNVSFEAEHAGPRVVWLTSNGDPDGGHKWEAGGPKLGARLTVETPAQGYLDWAHAQGVTNETISALADSGGDPAEWWVSTRPIHRTAITALDIYANEEFGLAALRLDGADLRRLFQSRGAQRALGLVEVRTRMVRTPFGEMQVGAFKED